MIFCLIFSLFLGSLGYEDVGRLHSQHRVYPDGALTAVEWYFCDKGVKLCSSDLRGYYIGCYTDNDEPEKHYHACPDGTRCGCQIDEICDLEPMCIQIKVPYPMIDKATFRFNGMVEYDHYWQEPRKQYTAGVSGVVKQDVSQKKYLQLISHEEHTAKSFEMIIPNEQGHLTKYTGYSDGKYCKKENISEFEPFGADIKNYHLISSINTSDGKVRQTWGYRLLYDAISFILWEWRWTILSDPLSGTSIPVSTYYQSDGEEDWVYELSYNETQRVIWETSDINTPWTAQDSWFTSWWDDDNGDWFRVPEICTKTSNEAF